MLYKNSQISFSKEKSYFPEIFYFIFNMASFYGLYSIITHFTCFTMGTSIIMNIHFFSPSLLMTSCLGNIQWRWAPTALVSCCNSRFLNASCFLRHKCPLFFRFSISNALARHWSFAGAPVVGFRQTYNLSLICSNFVLYREK